MVIVTTDLSLGNAETIRIYGMRWSIETFFKMTKSHLKLGSFYLFADEIMDLDLKTALRQLMAFVLNLLPDKPEIRNP